MVTEKMSVPLHSEQTKRRWIDWPTILLAIFVLALGVGIAFSVSEFGPLVLLAIPLIFVFIAALGWPELGLVAFIAITFTQLSDVGIKTYGFPSLAQPLAGLLMLLILVRMTLYGERPLGWVRAGPILIIYAIVWFASLLHANNYLLASDAFVGFIKDALGAVIVIFFIQRPSSLKGAIWAVIVAGLFMGAISTFQALTGTFNNNYFGFGQWDAQNTGNVTRSRVTGPYANANAFAQSLVFIAPLALDRLWHERQIFLRVVAGAALTVGVLTIFFTYSRGGFLALLFALGMLLALRRPNFFPIVITFLLAYVLFQFLPDSYSSRISTLFQLAPAQNNVITDVSFVGRTSENTAAWRMFIDHPILGVGLGNFKDNYQNYAREIGLDSRRVQRNPASLYLEMLSEQGIVGTIVFVFLLGLIFREMVSARNNFRRSGLNEYSFMVIAMMAGFSGYLFSAIFKNSAYSNVFWVIVGLAIAAGQVAYNSRYQALETRQSNPG
jgi:putative inorganic carbon (hco3(-)) transporter